MTSRTGWGLVTALMVVLAAAPPAGAQAGRAVAGGALGVAGGAATTLAVVVARARFQHEYLESINDLIHWQTAPMLIGPAAGAVFGLAGTDALRGSVIGATAGMAVGASVGAALGWLVAGEPESPWSGGVIGGGMGVAIGGLAGGLNAWYRDRDAELNYPALLRFGLSFPVR